MLKQSELQTMIKKSAERYGLPYNSDQLHPKVELEDGMEKQISKEDLMKVFKA